MSIQYKVLGRPGRDNAVFVWLNTGCSMYRILFDCGENIFYELKQSDVKSIDYLFFSHLHIDHAAGFDYYFRRNFDRQKTNYIWGPEETSELIRHRLRGFKWNLIGDTQGEFVVSDIMVDSVNSKKFITSESFNIKHSYEYPFISRFENSEIVIIDNPHFMIKAILLNHLIPTVAYRIIEKDSINISKDALESSGLTPGNWLEAVRDLSINEDTIIETDGQRLNLKELRKQLIRITSGESICYLTDFLYNEASNQKLINFINKANIMICESQYHHDDLDLAQRNYHLTSRQAASLAKEGNVNKLVLFHLSERYTTTSTFLRLLEDARSVFSETYFPEGWSLSAPWRDR